MKEIELFASFDFIIDVIVEPHGQQVTNVQMSLEFIPGELEALDVSLNPSLPVSNNSSSSIDNEQGRVSLLVEGTSSFPTDTFTLASVTFRVNPETVETVVSIGLSSEVKSGGLNVTGDHSSTTTVTVQQFDPGP
ncbi:MAG: hypothetical protein L0177_18695 [Chloroflexi bacterium]|nr:hypothetical protein [Chloroflexota bacterium]